MHVRLYCFWFNYEWFDFGPYTMSQILELARFGCNIEQGALLAGALQTGCWCNIEPNRVQYCIPEGALTRMTVVYE